jgi:hypothetical protein
MDDNIHINEIMFSQRHYVKYFGSGHKFMEQNRKEAFNVFISQLITYIIVISELYYILIRRFKCHILFIMLS